MGFWVWLVLLAWTFAYALVCCFELDSLGFWPIIFASVFFWLLLCVLAFLLWLLALICGFGFWLVVSVLGFHLGSDF